MIEIDLRDSSEEFNKFDDFLKQIPDGCTEDLRVIISGLGGYVMEQAFYIDFFDRYEGNVTLVCSEAVASADGDIFLFSNTKKELSVGASCLLHQCNGIIANFQNPAFIPSERYKQKLAEVTNDFFNEKCKQILDEEDFAVFESGEDLILTGEKLRQVTERAEKAFWKGKKTKGER
jgi:hypothetical protein